MAFLCILRPCQKWGDDANRPVIISTIHHVEAAVQCNTKVYIVALPHLGPTARVEIEIPKSYVARTLKYIKGMLQIKKEQNRGTVDWPFKLCTLNVM